MIRPTFGDFDFEENHCRVSHWTNERSIRDATAAVPRSDVARALTGYRGPRTITVEGWMASSSAFASRSDFLAARSDLINAHGPGYRRLSLDEDRFCIAECKSITTAEGNEYQNYLTFSVKYQTADPTTYDSITGLPLEY